MQHHSLGHRGITSLLSVQYHWGLSVICHSIYRKPPLGFQSETYYLAALAHARPHKLMLTVCGLLCPSLFSSLVCSVSRPVDGRLCDGNEPPLAVQSCSVPCQHHCVLSQWSSWGPCIHENCKEPQGKKGMTTCTRSEKQKKKPSAIECFAETPLAVFCLTCEGWL